jgi:hypothetical protein
MHRYRSNPHSNLENNYIINEDLKADQLIHIETTMPMSDLQPTGVLPANTQQYRAVATNMANKITSPGENTLAMRSKEHSVRRKPIIQKKPGEDEELPLQRKLISEQNGKLQAYVQTPTNTKDAAPAKTPFQAKLSVNTPGDPYEVEADAMADKVMRMVDPFLPLQKATVFNPSANPIHRKCAECEEEEHIHRKENSGAETEGSNELDNYVSTLSSSGHSLSESSRQFFEPRFGQDFSGVRVHTDSVAAKSAQSINALAYTTGNNIVFNHGQYSPGSQSGQRLLAHELTHVVQQSPTIHRKKEISFELEGEATNGATPKQKVKNWIKSNLALIENAESTWRVDKRAIAGTIIWEALENVRTSVRAVGPGKFHFKDTIIPYKEGEPISKETEDLGYLPKQTMESRKGILKTTDGSINYIGAILRAIADTASGYGYDIRCDPPILCTFYNGFHIQKIEDDLKAKKNHEPLQPSPDMMGNWVKQNLSFIEECVGKSNICKSGTAPKIKQTSELKRIAPKSLQADNALTYSSGYNVIIPRQKNVANPASIQRKDVPPGGETNVDADAGVAVGKASVQDAGADAGDQVAPVPAPVQDGGSDAGSLVAPVPTAGKDVAPGDKKSTDAGVTNTTTETAPTIDSQFTPGGHTAAPPDIAACPDAPAPVINVVGCITGPSSPPLLKEKAVLPQINTSSPFNGNAALAEFAKKLAACKAARTLKGQLDKRHKSDVDAAKAQATKDGEIAKQVAIQEAIKGIDPKNKTEIKKATLKAIADSKKEQEKKITAAREAVAQPDEAQFKAGLAATYEAYLIKDFDNTMRLAIGSNGGNWLKIMQKRLESSRGKFLKEKSKKPKVVKGQDPPPTKTNEGIAKEVEVDMVRVRCDQTTWVLDQLDSFRRGWAIGRREQVDFETLSQKTHDLKNLNPAYVPDEKNRVPIPANVLEGGTKTPVAPELADFLANLSARPDTPAFTASNRPDHGGDKFKGMGFSTDLMLKVQSNDFRGFYPHSIAVRFLLELDATAKAMGARWRVLYNDFGVAKEVNETTGSQNVIFTGNSIFTGDSRKDRLNWHGPAPMLLHFHLDLEIAQKTAPATNVDPAPSVHKAGSGEK